MAYMCVYTSLLHYLTLAYLGGDNNKDAVCCIVLYCIFVHVLSYHVVSLGLLCKFLNPVGQLCFLPVH